MSNFLFCFFIKQARFFIKFYNFLNDYPGLNFKPRRVITMLDY